MSHAREQQVCLEIPLQSLSRAPIIFVLAIKDKEFSWDAQYGCRKLSEYNNKCAIVTRDVQLQSAPALCVISLMQQRLTVTILRSWYLLILTTPIRPVCALSNTFTVPTFMLLQGRQQAGHAGGGGAAQPRHPGHPGDGLGDRQGLATPGLSVSSDSYSSLKIGASPWILWFHRLD